MLIENKSVPFIQDYVEFDQMYGESQTLIGEVFLLCENHDLSLRINDLNEKFYRTKWSHLDQENIDKAIDLLKIEAISLISDMQNDIKRSTRFERSDFWHMISGLWAHKAKKGTEKVDKFI